MHGKSEMKMRGGVRPRTVAAWLLVFGSCWIGPPGAASLHAGGPEDVPKRAADAGAELASAAPARFASASALPADAARLKPLAPAQPHEGVRRFEIGVGPKSYVLFEPEKPRPERAPVVVFLHGWFAVNPGFYGAWIDHLVRDGRIVIFPRYQNDVGTAPRDFLPNAMAAVHDALTVLHLGAEHVRPDPERFALIGHSAGGNLAAQIAALSANPHANLPVPRTVIAVMPGEIVPIRKPSLDQIPAATLMLVMVGEEDIVVGDLRAREIFEGATAVPPARKRFVVFRSDRHGNPPLIADHAAPTGTHPRLDNGEGLFRSLQLSFGEVNALDRAGFWKMADATLSAAFAGKSMEDATHDLEAFRHLGYWSDGRRVTPPVVVSDLKDAPRVILYNGLKLFPWSFPLMKPPAPPLQAERAR